MQTNNLDPHPSVTRAPDFRGPSLLPEYDMRCQVPPRARGTCWELASGALGSSPRSIARVCRSSMRSPWRPRAPPPPLYGHARAQVDDLSRGRVTDESLPADGLTSRASVNYSTLRIPCSGLVKRIRHPGEDAETQVHAGTYRATCTFRGRYIRQQHPRRVLGVYLCTSVSMDPPTTSAKTVDQNPLPGAAAGDWLGNLRAPRPAPSGASDPLHSRSMPR